MDIRIGKYAIQSDTLCFTVTEVQEVKEGKGAGTYVHVRPTYHTTLTSCINNIIDRGVRASEATTMKELKQDIAEIREMIKEALEE